MEIKQKEFCRLTSLTRKALLVYEEKGLLSPCRIDQDTGYRYYGSQEIERGAKISFLRSLSFSIHDILVLVDETDSATKILKNKERELQDELQKIRHGIQFIELNQDYPFPFSCELRETSLPIYRVATIEGRGEARDITIHHKLLYQQMKEHIVTSRGDRGTYFFSDSTHEEYHFKVFMPIDPAWVQTIVPFAVEQFGVPRFTYLRHYGTYELLHKTYEEMYRQFAEFEMPLSGEYFEIYRNAPLSSGVVDTSTLITDIGVPQWV